MKCPYHNIELKQSPYTPSSLVCYKCKEEKRLGKRDNDGIWHKSQLNNNLIQKENNSLELLEPSFQTFNYPKHSETYKKLFQRLKKYHVVFFPKQLDKFYFLKKISLKNNQKILYITNNKKSALILERRCRMHTEYVYQFLKNSKEYLDSYHFFILGDTLRASDRLEVINSIKDQSRIYNLR